MDDAPYDSFPLNLKLTIETRDNSFPLLSLDYARPGIGKHHDESN